MVIEYHVLIPVTVHWGCIMIFHWSLNAFHLSRLAEQWKREAIRMKLINDRQNTNRQINITVNTTGTVSFWITCWAFLAIEWKFDRLGDLLDEIVLFSVHIFSVIIWHRDVIRELGNRCHARLLFICVSFVIVLVCSFSFSTWFGVSLFASVNPRLQQITFWKWIRYQM